MPIDAKDWPALNINESLNLAATPVATIFNPTMTTLGGLIETVFALGKLLLFGIVE